MRISRVGLRETHMLMVVALVLSTGGHTAAQDFQDDDTRRLLFEAILRVGSGFDLNDNDDLFGSATGASLGLRHVFNLGPGLPLFFGGLEAVVSRLDLTIGGNATVFQGGARAGVDFRPIPRLLTGVNAAAGYYVLRDESGSGVQNFAVSAAARAGYRITPHVSVSASAELVSLFGLIPAGPDGGSDEALLQATFGVSTTYHFGVPNLQPWHIEGHLIEVVYGHLPEHYRTAPVGTATLRHRGAYPIERVTAFASVDALAPAPRPLAIPSSLGPDEWTAVPIRLEAPLEGRLAERGGTGEVEISIGYRYRGWNRSQRMRLPVRVIGRDTIDWEDPRHLALFVHSTEPTIAGLAAGIATTIERVGTRAVDPAVRAAAAIHAYARTIRPGGAEGPGWATIGGEREVSGLEFPRAAIAGNGALDPVSRTLLEAALLEAAGYRTALVLSDDRLLLAVAPVTPAADLAAVFASPESLIGDGDERWFVYAAGRADLDLLAAHREAVAAHAATESTRIIPLRDAWVAFPPADLSGDGDGAPELQRDQLVAAFRTELEPIVASELEPRAAQLLARVSAARDDRVAANRLGVLYARYHRYPEASRIFSDILLDEEYVPALVNAGNVLVAQGEPLRALPFFRRAIEQEPFNPNVLLALAEVEHALENYGNAALAYQRLASIEPALAERYSYLTLRGEESVRAAREAGLDDLIEWQAPAAD